MDGMKCHAHYRATVAACACGNGLCAECAAGGDGRCSACRERERSATVQMEVQRDARIALRRAGVAVSRRHGDPIFLRANGHPLAVGLSLMFCVVTALALGACAALGELRWGVPRAAIAPVLGIALGMVVTAVLGGTSRAAGFAAVLLAALAVAGGGEALSMVTPVSLPGPGDATAWLQGHQAALWALDASALVLAYLTAAGRRV